MNIPAFTAEVSLKRTNTPYGATVTGDIGLFVRPAQIIKNSLFCERHPELCKMLAQQPSVQVNWLKGPPGQAYVFVIGENFAANSAVQADVSNCSGPYAVKVGAITDANGTFTTWVPCDCGGSTTVTASDVTGNRAKGTAALSC